MLYEVITTVNRLICKRNIENSTATITALVPAIGYEKASKIAQIIKEKEITVKAAVNDLGYLTEKEFEELISPEAVCKLGN